MNIRDRHSLFRSVSDTLDRDGARLKQLLLLYLGIITALSLGASLLTVVLSERIADTGGLRNMGLRSVLSTVQTLLPMVQSIVSMGLQIGYCTAALYAVRGSQFSRDTLLGGFRRFFPMMWSYFLQLFLYISLGITCVYLGSYIFMMLPMSAPLQSLMTPVMESINVMSETIAVDDATVAAITEALRPALWFIAALYLPILIPTIYRYRMVLYRIIDQSHPRAMLALRESRMMMHRNRIALLKVDLSLWWYYALQALILLVCYGDILLSLMGITLPWSDNVSYFLFLSLSLALQFVVFYFTMNRVTLVYASAYESMIPDFEEKKRQLIERHTAMMQARKPWKQEN